jgi:hypothetical protein
MRTYLLAFAVALAAACGTTPPSHDAACTQLSAARCQRLAACSTADLGKRFADLASCEARQQLACLAGLDAPDTGATPATADACAATIPTESCPQFLGNDPTDACLPQTGARAQGAACEFSGQCSTMFCAVSSTAACGTCQAKPVAGTSCASAGCGPGLVCVASTQLCQVPVAAAGACSADLPCTQGTTCVGADAGTGVMGSCMAELTTAGATCDPKRATGPDCSSDAGFTCDTTTKQCVAQPVVAAGMTCGPVAGVATRCAAGAMCVKPSGSTTGTCVAPAADGAACDSVAGPGCLYPAKCVAASTGGTAGTCELPGDPSCS